MLAIELDHLGPMSISTERTLQPSELIPLHDDWSAAFSEMNGLYTTNASLFRIARREIIQIAHQTGSIDSENAACEHFLSLFFVD